MPKAEAVVPILINQFKGMNSRKDPANLDVGETDDLLNVVSSGTAVGKRPGLTNLMGAAAFGGTGQRAVYDMIETALQNTNAAPAKDCLFVIYAKAPSSANPPSWGYYDLFNNSTTDVGAIDAVNMATDGLFQVKLRGPAGGGMIIISSPGVGPIYKKIVPTGGGSTDYSVANMAAIPAETNYTTAEWHRQYLWWVKYVLQDFPYRLRFSDFNLPESYPSANFVDLNPTGRVNEILGAWSTEDILYIGTTAAMWGVTGSSTETFRLERFFSDYGVLGSRCMARVGKNLIGFVCSRAPSSNVSGAADLPTAVSIAIFGGFDGKIIGDPISPSISPPIASDDKDRARAAYWTSKRLVVLIPQVPLETSQTEDIFILDMISGGWYKWNVPGALLTPSNGINSLTYFNKTMYVGMGDGKIRFFDDTAFNDDGTAFTSYWTSHWANINRDSAQTFEYLKIAGSGGFGNTDLTISVGKDFGTLNALSGTFPLKPEGIQISMRDQIGEGKFHKVKIQFSSSLTATAKINTVVLGLKPMDDVSGPTGAQ